MGFDVILRDSGPEMVTVTERLCLTEDGRLVAETDPAARWLWAVPGQQKPRVEAVRYGYSKAADTPANKAMPAPANKGESDLEALRQHAAALGIKVDGRWSAQRLQQEINAKENP